MSVEYTYTRTPEKKVKLAILFVLVGAAFYFNFQSKKNMFWSSEYLYKRMFRDQKAVHLGTEHKVSTARDRYRKLENSFEKVYSRVKSKLNLTQEQLKQINSIVIQKEASPLWNKDIFKQFRSNWEGQENSGGNYKKFSRKDHSEYRKDKKLFIHFYELINKRNESFYALNTFKYNSGKIIFGEVIDITENLSWPSIGWPLGQNSVLWFTLIDKREGQSSYKISIESVINNELVIKGLEVLVDNNSAKILKIDKTSGSFKAIQ